MRSGLGSIVLIGAIAAIGGGACDFLPSNPGSLAVGDCFDPPTTTQDTVQDVRHLPCTEPHGGEVVFVGIYEPVADAYPSEDQFRSFVGSRCIPAFNSYTGLAFETATDLDVSVFTPTREGWGNGDRKVICYAVRIDAGDFTQSIKAAQ